jgi:Putative Ig domain
MSGALKLCPPPAGVVSFSITGQVDQTSGTLQGTLQGIALPPIMVTVQGIFTLQRVTTGSLSITTTSLPDGVIGAAYPSTQLQATGGTGNYSWALTAGSPVPDGLTLDPATGAITGTISNSAESAGNFDPLQRQFSVPVTVMDSSGMTASAPLSITVTCGDDRDTVIGSPNVSNPPVASYISFGVVSKLSKSDPGAPFAPRCMDFSTAPTSSLFYTFPELNHSNTMSPDWALLSKTLINSGLDSWYRNMFVAIVLGVTSWNPSSAPYGGLDSAYRTPADQIRVYLQQGSTNPPKGSRHMFGDAADLRNIPLTIENWNALVTNAQDATPPARWIEPKKSNAQCSLYNSNGQLSGFCVHADWRERPVPFAGQ